MASMAFATLLTPLMDLSEPLTTSTSSVRTAAGLPDGVFVWRVAVNGPAHVATGGATVTATASHPYFPGPFVEYFKAQPGQYVAILAEGAGKATATPMSA